MTAGAATAQARSVRGKKCVRADHVLARARVSVAQYASTIRLRALPALRGRGRVECPRQPVFLCRHPLRAVESFPVSDGQMEGLGCVVGRSLARVVAFDVRDSGSSATE